MQNKIGFFENNDGSKSFKILSGFMILLFDMIILFYSVCISHTDIGTNALALLITMNGVLPFIYKFQTTENIETCKYDKCRNNFEDHEN